MGSSRSSAPRVIFSADDFGMAVPVNEAVERAHREGVLSTTSLMVAGAASADAVERARRLPGLNVGLHLTLVHERPLLAASTLPALVDADGRLLDDLPAAGVRFFFAPGARRQLEAEVRAQFRAFAATGLRLDHVNAHAHLHVHPTVFGILLRVGREFGSPPIRIPFEPAGASSGAAASSQLANALLLGPWCALMAQRSGRAGVRHPDRVFGLNDTGRMTAPRVRAILARLPPGVSELYFHVATGRWPGMDPGLAGYRLEDELAALTDPAVVELVRSGRVVAATYRDLAA